MLLALTASEAIVLVAALLFLLVSLVALVVFLRTFTPWMRSFMSGTPVSVFDILGMRFRRTDVNAVVKALILAKQAGVVLFCRQVEQAYLQGVDLERLALGRCKVGVDLGDWAGGKRENLFRYDG